MADMAPMTTYVPKSSKEDIRKQMQRYQRMKRDKAALSYMRKLQAGQGDRSSME